MNPSCLVLTFAVFSMFITEGTVAQKFITGQVTYVGPVNIGESAQMEVTLRDVTLEDAPSRLIASISMSNPTTFPISYQLEYNPLDISAGFVYAISARITGADNRLLYVNNVRTIVPLIETPSPNVDIAVIRVASTSSTVTPKVDTTTVCPPVLCLIFCPYGYRQQNGCDICECYDPCNPSGKAICPAGRQCFVERSSDGTFRTRCKLVPKYSGGYQSVNRDCFLPKVVGSCKARVLRYYYNPIIKACESFYYGGCEGNANNFETKAACEAACKA